MAPSSSDKALSLSRKKALFESRREREFYRYFEPIRALTAAGPPSCDLADPQSVLNHLPQSSPDRALTAFCQLAALRLGVKRAMLFFFDSNNAYVLAESTRSLSLQNDSFHDDQDHLWLGHSIIPRGFSVCEETVCSDSKLLGGLGKQGTVHIIPDMREDTAFCDRPFVTGEPRARFYAGVPITTPKGIKIGAFCCLDDQRRDSLDVKSIVFLEDMAETVMAHLEMVRAKAEHERGTQMVSGLGAFVEGASSLRDFANYHDRRLQRKTRSPEPLTTPPLTPNMADAALLKSAMGAPSDSVIAGLVRESGLAPSGQSDLTPSQNSLIQLPLASAKTTRGAADLRERIVTNSVTLTFERAAHLIREAVDVTGSMFLDTTIGTFGGLTSTTAGGDSVTDTSSGVVTTSAESTSTESEGSRCDNSAAYIGKPCNTLALSQICQPNAAPADQRQPMTEKFLKSLLSRFPRGKCFNFNDQGDVSSDDDSSESSRTETEHDETSRKPSTSSSKQRKRRRLRVNDCKEIQRLFPNVRSLAIVGMWDQHRGRWFSACIIWSYSPYRSFSESDLHFLSAFTDVIMSEVHRLEAINSDKAKTDFVSSISHELRSPLHGILGSVECLQDMILDPFSTGLVSQVDVCARTLLDIIDHVLDYSKIHQQADSQAQVDGDGKIKRRRRESWDAARRARLGGIMNLDADVALDEVTEEVVEAATYSFYCSRDKNAMMGRKVTTILDIDRSKGTRWRCHAPLGGWKRIVINLLSNALKYTREGYVQVSLRQAPIPGKRRKFNVILTVTDSGRGMARQYLENHLFEAFSQEDTLVEGSGLGMSLVAKILRALGGRIDVQSEKEVGTTMTVTLPMEREKTGTLEHGGATPGAELSEPSLISQQFEGRSIGLVEFNQKERTAGSGLLLSSLEKCCSDLGLQPEVVDGMGLLPEHDVYLITEKHMDAWESQRRQPLQQPVLVLCDNSLSERRRRTAPPPWKMFSRIEYVAQPCGPVRLARTINSCFEPKMPAWNPVPESSQSDVKSSEEQKRPSLSAGEQFELSRSSSNDTGSGLPSGGSESVLVSTDASPTSTRSPPSGIVDRMKMQFEHEEDYFSARSRSTGDIPQSPQVVVPTLGPKVKLSPLSRPRSHTTASAPLDASRPVQIARNSDPAPDPANGLSLLLVDDNHINLQLLVNYAKKQGHRKLTANDGQQAVDAYKAACLAQMEPSKVGATKDTVGDPPSVVLMDINMPVLNGFEATRQIRAFEKQHSLRPCHIIALTGMGSAVAQQEAFSSGVDLFLTKPVRLKELTKLLQSIREAEPTEERPEDDSST